MRNALFHSHPYNLGNADFQMTDWNTQMNMTRKFGFCMGSKASESDNYHSRISGGFCEVSLDQPSHFTYQPGYSSGEFRYDHGIFQHPLLFGKSSINPATQFEEVIQNGRKRQISDINGIFSNNELGGSTDETHERTGSNEWNTVNKHKRNKVTNSQPQWHNQYQQTSREIQDNEKLQVPVRRNQKLSDKITALQKLVSPYGKTDTASVLQEASVYIMLLQKQVENLHRIFSSSYTNAIGGIHKVENCDQECGGSTCQGLDLRSKGLCLVPISMTYKVTMEEGFDEDHLSTSRNFVIANNF